MTFGSPTNLLYRKLPYQHAKTTLFDFWSLNVTLLCSHLLSLESAYIWSLNYAWVNVGCLETGITLGSIGAFVETPWLQFCVCSIQMIVVVRVTRLPSQPRPWRARHQRLNERASAQSCTETLWTCRESARWDIYTDYIWELWTRFPSLTQLVQDQYLLGRRRSCQTLFVHDSGSSLEGKAHRRLTSLQEQVQQHRRKLQLNTSRDTWKWLYLAFCLRFQRLHTTRKNFGRM